MTVPTKMGEDWIKKGYAKDLSQPAPESDPDQMGLMEEIEMIIEDEGSELDQETEKTE